MFKSHRFVVRTLAMLVLPVVLLTEPAAANSSLDDSPLSVKVPYRDLNLATSQGVVSLYARIQAAAEIVCRSTEGPQLVNSIFWSEWHSCLNTAVERAVRAVHNDHLSTYHWKQMRGAKPYWVHGATLPAR
jgi:UrcA family protein